MLKIKDNSKFQQIIDKYDLDYEADSDYEIFKLKNILDIDKGEWK